jgi:hypothetical protein
MLPGCQELPGELEPGCLPELMRRGAEDGLELPDEMKGRDLHVAGEVVDCERPLSHFEQQIAGATQPPEAFMPQEHDS